MISAIQSIARWSGYARRRSTWEPTLQSGEVDVGLGLRSLIREKLVASTTITTSVTSREICKKTPRNCAWYFIRMRIQRRKKAQCSVLQHSEGVAPNPHQSSVALPSQREAYAAFQHSQILLRRSAPRKKRTRDRKSKTLRTFRKQQELTESFKKLWWMERYTFHSSKFTAYTRQLLADGIDASRHIKWQKSTKASRTELSVHSLFRKINMSKISLHGCFVVRRSMLHVVIDLTAGRFREHLSYYNPIVENKRDYNAYSLQTDFVADRVANTTLKGRRGTRR